MGADAGAIIRRLDEEPDVTIRRALLSSLGEYGELSADARKSLLPKVQEMYRTASDPGIHASAEWLLRTWKEEVWLKQTNDGWMKEKEQREKRLDGIKEILGKEKEKTPPQWYFNGQGQTMVVIPGPVEFIMGSPSTEANRRDQEDQIKKRIARTFAVTAKSVTVEQYRQYNKMYTFKGLFPPAPDCPAVNVSWYEAASYCNWISKEEGIDSKQWCYETNEKGQVTKIRENYLALAGYRLPTEAEMEYAIRAGAKTTWHFGNANDLLSKYDWYQKNSQERTRPVGELKPNEFGLFDAHGNAYTWCQERYKSSYATEKNGKASEDTECDVVVDNTLHRVVRGGSYYNTHSFLRSANRARDLPTYRDLSLGFRFRMARSFSQIRP